MDETLSLMLRHTMLLVEIPVPGEKVLRLRPSRSMEDIMVEVVAVVDEGAWMFVVRNWLPVAGNGNRQSQSSNFRLRLLPHTPYHSKEELSKIAFDMPYSSFPSIIRLQRFNSCTTTRMCSRTSSSAYCWFQFSVSLS